MTSRLTPNLSHFCTNWWYFSDALLFCGAASYQVFTGGSIHVWCLAYHTDELNTEMWNTKKTPSKLHKATNLWLALVGGVIRKVAPASISGQRIWTHQTIGVTLNQCVLLIWENQLHQRDDMNAPAGVGVTFALLCWCYFGITLVLLLRAAFWRGVACLCWCLVLGGRGSDQVPRWRASLHCTARLLLARFHCCLHTSWLHSCLHRLSIAIYSSLHWLSQIVQFPNCASHCIFCALLFFSLSSDQLQWLHQSLWFQSPQFSHCANAGVQKQLNTTLQMFCETI